MTLDTVLPVDERDEMRIDELARRAGVASTTVRLYQNKGLLPRPRLAGRTGYYDESHLGRLRLIDQLQEQGFSLAGIGQLIATWEEGRDLSDLVGAEEQLEAFLSRRFDVVLEPAEVLARLPGVELTPELLERVTALGLAEPTNDGRLRIPDQRFLDTGAALLKLGVPVDTVLDEWEHLAKVTDGIARRFIAVFENHVLPDRWEDELDAAETSELASALARLRHAASQVVAAALDASLARVGTKRLGELVPPPQRAER